MIFKKNLKHPIKDIESVTYLTAIKNLLVYENVLKNRMISFSGDGGEYEYKLNRAYELYNKDIDKLINSNPEKNNYIGLLSVESLLDAFSEYYDLLISQMPHDEDEANFLIAYEFLCGEFPIQTYYKSNFFWDDIHQDIKKVSYKRFQSKHYVDAVESAFKQVIKRLKDYVNSKTERKYDGDKLMHRAFDFSEQEPIIKFNNLKSIEEKDEQRGLQYLFKGIVALRNRKAHENVIIDDSNLCLEYLALASLLMRLLDKYIK
ncbi:TIGR02391 family protein [Patescibacteria group bacterium]|nr:TIGR02391 family protein [Patescibacteria group bacterium]